MVFERVLPLLFHAFSFCVFFFLFDVMDFFFKPFDEAPPFKFSKIQFLKYTKFEKYTANSLAFAIN
jgi:hypothetical protein